MSYQGEGEPLVMTFSSCDSDYIDRLHYIVVAVDNTLVSGLGSVTLKSVTKYSGARKKIFFGWLATAYNKDNKNAIFAGL